MKIGALFILGLFLINSVFALTATQDSLDVAIIPEFNQPVSVPLTINDAIAGTYNVYTLTAVKLLPETPFYLETGKNNLTVEVLPNSDLNSFGPAAYTFVYSFHSKSTNQNFENKMTVRVVSIGDAFEVSSDTNSPDSEKITFYVRNRESINLKNVHAHFTSMFFDFEQTFDLNANEKKEISFNVGRDIIKKTETGSYLLTAVFDTDRGQRTLEGRIFLGEKKGVENKEKTTGLLIRSTEISRINYGNVYEDVSVTAKRNIISRLFTSFSIEPDNAVRNGFGMTYTWQRKLGPAESFEVTVKSNYIYPILIIIAVALLIWAFRRYTQTKIEVTKSAHPIRTKTGQFALKVRITLHARKRVENVSIIDRIPGVVQIHERFDSLLKPSKIDVKNKRIQWDLGEIGAGEERVVSYIVYSTLGVVGKFALPRALTVFETAGNIHEVESNEVYFLAEQKAMDE